MDEPCHKNLMEALRWLQSEGYKIKKSKLYKDAKDGLVPTREDGSVRGVDVRAYSASLNRRDDPADVIGENAERKFKAEIRKIEASARMTEFDLAVKEGKYILRDDAVRARIDQMQILEVHFRQVLDTKLPEWISVAGGNQRRLNDVRDMAALAVDEMMNGLARSDTFTVVYDDDGGL